METRILIADDDKNALSSLATLLTELGYEIAMADSLDSAERTAAQFRPAVAIVVPTLSGSEPAATARRLRAACPSRAPLLIALTGWGQSQYRDAALEAGFDVHLVRPVGIDQLTFILSMTGR